MSDRTVNISIKTTADNDAADATTKSLDNLDQQQGKVNKTSTESKAASVSAGKGFAAVGQAASAAASGGIGPLSAAMGGLTQQIPMLAGAAGPIAMAIAAFTAWKSVIDAVVNAQEQLKQGLIEIQLGNQESNIRSLTDAYKTLTDQLSAASAEVSRYYSAESAGADAIKRSELAKLDLQAAERKAGLDPSDQTAARRLDLDIARQKAAIEEESAKRALESERKAIALQTDITRAQYGAASEQRAALPDQAAALLSQQARITERAREKADSRWTDAGKEEVWAAAGKDLQRIAAEIEKIKTEMQAAVRAQDEAAGQLANLAAASGINSLNQSTMSISGAAAARGFRNTESAINYEQRTRLQTEAQAAQAERDTIMSRRSELSSVRDKERGDVRRGLNSGLGSEEMKQQLEEYKKANENMSAYFKESYSQLSKLNREISSAKEALKNLPK